jgi:hypothetical protein
VTSFSRVDKAAVISSIALCNLAEVPQVRPALVSGGALRLLKAWLELGSDIMIELKNVGAADTSHHRQCLKNCTLTSDLINNAAAAIMYILGGQTDCRINHDYDCIPTTMNDVGVKRQFSSGNNTKSNSKIEYEGNAFFVYETALDLRVDYDPSFQEMIIWLDGSMHKS